MTFIHVMSLLVRIVLLILVVCLHVRGLLVLFHGHVMFVLCTFSLAPLLLPPIALSPPRRPVVVGVDPVPLALRGLLHEALEQPRPLPEHLCQPVGVIAPQDINELFAVEVHFFLVTSRIEFADNVPELVLEDRVNGPPLLRTFDLVELLVLVPSEVHTLTGGQLGKHYLGGDHTIDPGVAPGDGEFLPELSVPLETNVVQQPQPRLAKAVFLRPHPMHELHQLALLLATLRGNVRVPVLLLPLQELGVHQIPLDVGLHLRTRSVVAHVPGRRLLRLETIRGLVLVCRRDLAEVLLRVRPREGVADHPRGLLLRAADVARPPLKEAVEALGPFVVRAERLVVDLGLGPAPTIVLPLPPPHPIGRHEDHAVLSVHDVDLRVGVAIVVLPYGLLVEMYYLPEQHVPPPDGADVGASPASLFQ
mmetsp:Transcript_3298/g.7449  ORF Transcript_3298/g.7449 Transcript_3298/m.7449 type:complete len:420 (-) Transcript_3298:1306-2565(-)